MDFCNRHSANGIIAEGLGIVSILSTDGTSKVLTSFDHFLSRFIRIFLEILNEKATQFGDFLLEIHLSAP